MKKLFSFKRNENNHFMALHTKSSNLDMYNQEVKKILSLTLQASQVLAP